MTVRDLGDDDYDVVVVGGGPAGLSAGVRCANEGVKTLLIEKDHLSDNKRAWIIAVTDKRKQIFKSMDMDLSEIAENKITSTRISLELPNKEVFTLKGSVNLAGYYVKQDRLNRYMLDRSSSLNIKDGVRVVDCKRIGGKVSVKLSNNEIVKGKILIDASGALREPSRMLGRKLNTRALQIGYGYTISNIKLEDAGIDDPYTFMFRFDFVSNKLHVYWPYPAGENSVDFGVDIYQLFGTRYGLSEKDFPIGLDERKYCMHLLQPLMEKYRKIYPKAFQGNIEKTYYGIMSDGWETKPYGDNLLMVGESAGHSNDLDCEGVANSLILGDCAGSCAADAVTKEKFSESYLKRYYKTIKKKDLFNRGLTGYEASFMPRFPSFVCGFFDYGKKMLEKDPEHMSEIGKKFMADGSVSIRDELRYGPPMIAHIAMYYLNKKMGGGDR